MGIPCNQKALWTAENSTKALVHGLCTPMGTHKTRGHLLVHPMGGVLATGMKWPWAHPKRFTWEAFWKYGGATCSNSMAVRMGNPHGSPCGFRCCLPSRGATNDARARVLALHGSRQGGRGRKQEDRTLPNGGLGDGGLVIPFLFAGAPHAGPQRRKRSKTTKNKKRDH